MHTKIQQTPRKWPVPRKGTTFIARALSNRREGIPAVVLIRDVLKIAQNKKEVKKAINSGKILLNWRKINDEKNSVSLFDVITIVPNEKNYRLVIGKNGKFAAEEAKNPEVKTSKIINKKLLKGGKVQANLLDGSNFITDLKCSANDSAIVDLKNRKIERIVPLKDNSNAMVFEGKHAGEKGKVISIDKKHNIVEIDVEGRKVNALIKQVIITE